MASLEICVKYGWYSDMHVSTVHIKLVLKSGLSAYFMSVQLKTIKAVFKTNFICTVLTCVSEFQPM